MSKHLLYRKDLLNRTLTRGLLVVLPPLVFCLIFLLQLISPADAAGLLSVKSSSPRYFVDSKGNPVYLTGSYLNEYNLLSGSSDFGSHLDFLQQQKQNFTRVWGWEQSPWSYDANGQVTFSTQPYERTGPGLALDGGLKFDLTRFNQAYFDQLRSRVVEAAQRGIYVSVMLFEGFSTQKKLGRVNPWLDDPFQQANNINGINGDPNQNGGSEEFFSLAFPSLVSFQEAFARKVVDTLNDLDNVLYEVSGNGLAGSLSWQYHMIDYIKRDQKKTVNQHPVGISDFYAGATAEVFNSSADWIVIQETNLNPSPATTKKVLIMEGTPPVSGGQVLSTSPISLFQLLPDSAVSSQTPGISNSLPSSNGVTPSSSSATSSTLTTAKSSSNQQSQVATPTINPNGGVYSGTVAVTLQTTTPGASIYYTTDGQSPTQSSRLYTGKFKLATSTLIKAKAFKNNFDPSSEASAWFANAASPAVAGSGLVAHWKFDEGSGTTAADSSGNGNNGTLVNGPLWSAGRVGNALYFDGIDDNVTVLDSASLHLSSAFTLSAWINPASTSTDWKVILEKNDRYYLFSNVPGSSCGSDGYPFGGFSTTQINSVCQPLPVLPNTWTHLSLTYNGSVLTLYRDGVAVATSNVSGTFSSGTEILQIGASKYGEYFKGFIDEVRIYNRALTNTEIQTLYQQDTAVAVPQIVATPVISPNGGNYSGSASVTMQTATSGASIYYTTNGTSPTQSSTLYNGPMTLTNSATVKAKAFKTGSNASPEASASFTVTQPFSFSLANSGDKSVVTGSSVINSISTALVSGSAQAVTFLASGLPTGATASFSSTSCSPACSSTLNINTSGSTPAGSSTITVTAAGGGVTKTTAFSLTVSLPTVATPAISPSGGNYTGSVSVTIQTATSGASIYYTTNGSSPTPLSTLYTGAINLTSSTTVKAKAFKSGYISSAESSASFTVAAPLITAWTFCATENSPCNFSGTKEVRYGINGVYVSQIFTNGVACDNNVFGDPVVGWFKQCEYRDISNPSTVATPAISPSGGNYSGSVPVTMQTVTSGASIYYTTDGSSPTPLSTLYTGAMTLTSSATVKAKAFKSGYISSAESSASFTVAAPLITAWTFCATENSPCNFSGTKEVRYGTSGVYVSNVFTNGLLCGNSVFGDPVSGSIKQCEYRDVSPSFDFALSHSGNKSVVAGSSITNSINTTLVSGSSQAVAFSVSGLPTGATGFFSSASCNPSCSTVLIVNASGSTPAGNFPITITSTGGSVTRTTAFTLSVTLALNVATSTITPASGTGKTFYVATNGSDSNSGSFDRPFRTLAKGISVLHGGDALLIRGGTYNEDMVINEGVAPTIGGTASNRTWIGAYSADGATYETVIIRRQGSTAINIYSYNETINYITLDHLIADGNCQTGCSSTSGARAISIGPGGGFIRFQNLEAYYGGPCSANIFVASSGHEWINIKSHHLGMGDQGPCTGGGPNGHGFYMASGNQLFDRIEAYDNLGFGMQIYQAFVAPSNVILRNSYFHHNGAELTVYGNNHLIHNNVFTAGRTGTHALAIGGYGGNNNIVYNNTITGNSGMGIGVRGGSSHVVENNIAYNNSQGNIVVEPGVSATFDYNLCGSSGTGCDPITQHAVIGNPLFVDVANQNFQLQDGSPAINAGKSFIASGITTSTPNIGAY